ncbi:VOC family protein [archaeon]|nr:VOC family protein [archaeon]MBT3450531.1 VOC family protein [archaeon]MBT6868448.1 VOC family protein [archaeon]MBT7193547.1 VOC family protein [archaeon]MBT7381258.1 VOC family protein [archaeon]
MKFNKLIPELSVTNFEKSIQFYTVIIGFKIEYKREESKFAMISFQDVQLMIEEINDNWVTGKLEHPFGRGINLQIEVDKIKPILTNLKNNHYPLFIKLEENWYRKGNELLGNKEFLVQDPDGYLLRFSENLGSKPL